jgi:RimJ/RimL family protein N-acetyltransferase
LVEGRSPDGLMLPPEGIADPDVLEMLRGLANSIRPAFRPACWMMVEDDEIVGLCSIVKQPSDRGVDIGYGVSPGRRGLGFASAAVGALLAWGRDDERLLCIRAETSIDNIPSQRVLQRNGFDRVGERVDEEDGRLICWSASTAK